MTTRINKDLVGQIVCVYEPYANGGEVEKTIKVFSVTSVGSKYITAGGMKFDKDLLTNHDCGTRQLFLGSPEEFRDTLLLRKSLLGKLDNIRSAINEMDLPELKKLDNILATFSDSNK